MHLFVVVLFFVFCLGVSPLFFIIFFEGAGGVHSQFGTNLQDKSPLSTHKGVN